jgi:hypothetical protein
LPMSAHQERAILIPDFICIPRCARGNPINVHLLLALMCTAGMTLAFLIRLSFIISIRNADRRSRLSVPNEAYVAVIRQNP